MSHPLLQSLVQAPLLVEDLPEAPSFPRHDLVIPQEHSPLNFRQKLGHLYEDALALVLEASPRFELLERNLQLQKDRHTTIGELDFLVRELASGQLIHLELATKFYLAVPSENGLTLPGPDARDNYFRKLEKLRTHQLQLTKRFRDLLPTRYHQEPIVTRQLTYGCLFDHINATTPATAEFINPNCRRGKWLTISELPSHFPGNTSFRQIPKALWPVPLTLLDHHTLETWSPDSPVERCLMVYADNLPLFITPSGYPGTGKEHPESLPGAPEP